MKRHFAIGLVSLFICALGVASASADGVLPTRLVPEQVAQSAGLTRVWFAQATLDADREGVTSATLQDGTLFITTKNGMLQAFDAEKGTTLWTVEVGAGYLLPPAVNSKIAVAICGTRLVVYDRFDGKKIDETELYSQPSSGPVVGERVVYVPTFGNSLFAYSIKQRETESPELEKSVDLMQKATAGLKLSPELEKKFQETIDSKKDSRYLIEPLAEKRPYLSSLGNSLVAPILGTQSYESDFIGWTTDKGWFLVADLERSVLESPLKLKYRVHVTPSLTDMSALRIDNRLLIPRDDVQFSPFYVPQDVSLQNMRVEQKRRKGGMFLLGTQSGSVFAVNEFSGDVRWKFWAPSAVAGRVFAFDKQAYIPTESGELFALSLESGKKNWSAKGIRRLCAASATRIYAIDDLGRLAILNKVDGASIKTTPIDAYRIPVFNKESDRLYFVSADGLIQCFRETQQVEPLKYAASCAEIDALIKGEEDAEGASAVSKTPAAVKVPDAVAAPNVEKTTGKQAPNDAQSPAPEDDDPFGTESDDSTTPATAPAAAPATTPATTPAAPEEDENPFGGDDDDPFAANVL